MGEVGVGGPGDSFLCGCSWSPKDHWPPGLTVALCRPHRKDAARGVLMGWGAVTPMHRQHFQGGRQGTGKRVQGRHMGEWRQMRMEAGAPFLEALAPQRHTLHQQSLKRPQLPPLCPPALLSPSCNPLLHAWPALLQGGGSPSPTSHPILLKVRGAELGPGQDLQMG